MYNETVPGLVLFAANGTVEAITGHMSLYMIPDILPDSAGLAAHNALQLPCHSLPHHGADLGIHRLILTHLCCCISSFIPLDIPIIFVTPILVLLHLIICWGQRVAVSLMLVGIEMLWRSSKRLKHPQVLS